MSSASAARALAQLWSKAGLPDDSLKAIALTGQDCLPSSFLLSEVAQATIGASALAAAQLLALRTGAPLVQVTVDSKDAAAEFRSEQLATLDGEVGKVWDALVGQYRAKDGGWLRPHTNWKHHKLGLLKMLGLPETTGKKELARAFAARDANEVAEQAMKQGLVVTALRSFEQWDATPQGKVASKLGGPVKLERLQPRPPKPLPPLNSRRPLEGVRVLDLTRVIAGPTAGRTLAAYGADVLWVTAPHLPTLPGLDADTSRGKRTSQLDLRPSCPADRATFTSLLKSADVLLQAYRPGALASLGFSTPELLEINPDLVYATLSAYGEEGEWSQRKGFDSLVQFAVGINEAEGRAYGEFVGRAEEEFEPKAMPCQALDHGSGYLLAFGIQAALHRRATEGGAFKVENSLLGTATWLRSFGRAPSSAFSHPLETKEELQARGGIEELVGFSGGRLESVRHAARFEGAEVGWRSAPRGYNDVAPAWLEL
ncbi:CoA-transferase family III domain-containing protein [Leucosporidium creatinivorum]|uniref:CoA-transferase family III domain-containing protein n=1 Tax=Leucosporidium creatinivorum TaxID=106004 RepID=A0A1Y2F090_9BASI|nr:CoA-transferase family III domain-containing protein [Leucosporidium creatinivorum]